MKTWAGQLGRVAGIIRRGGVVAYPTASCYGLGCDPFKRRAVLRLLRLKQRPQRKGLIVIGAGRRQLLPFMDLGDITAEMRELMNAAWPGPVTLVLPAGRRCPPWLRGRHRGIALREDAHAPARDLCRAARTALVSTSANLAGQRPARTAAEVRRRLARRVDAILAGPIGRAKQPSRIIDARSGRVLRG